jgi:hypothetical protein
LADTLDILTLTEGKAVLNIPAAELRFDTRVAQEITAASRLVDSVYGPVVTRSVTRTFFEPRSSELLLDVPPGSPTFTLSNVAVTEYTAGAATVLAAETATAATGNDYRFRPAAAVLAGRGVEHEPPAVVPDLPDAPLHALTVRAIYDIRESL